MNPVRAWQKHVANANGKNFTVSGMHVFHHVCLDHPFRISLLVVAPSAACPREYQSHRRGTVGSRSL